MWDDQDYRLTETNLLAVGIPTLPPGKEVVALFDSIPERLQRDLPMSYTVYLSYEDQTGVESYGPEEYWLDLRLYVGLLAGGTPGLDAIAASLQSIDRRLQDDAALNEDAEMSADGDGEGRQPEKGEGPSMKLDADIWGYCRGCDDWFACPAWFDRITPEPTCPGCGATPVAIENRATRRPEVVTTDPPAGSGSSRPLVSGAGAPGFGRRL